MQRRPWLTAAFAVVVMLVIAIPMLSMRLGFSDDGGTPKGSSTRIAYDLTAEGFGPGVNGPFSSRCSCRRPATRQRSTPWSTR